MDARRSAFQRTISKNSQPAASPGANMQSSPSPVFQVSGLTKVYHTGELDVHALRGIDLELCESEFIILLGPSGSGKSTLLNILGAAVTSRSP